MAKADPHFHIRRDDERNAIRFLSGRNVVPECRLAAGTISKDEALRSVTCVVDVIGHDFTADSAKPLRSIAIMRTTRETKEGIRIVRVEQRNGDVRVRGGRLSVVFLKGVVTQVSGRLVGAQPMTAPAPAPRELVAIAEKAAGQPVVLDRRQYDPRTSKTSSFFRDDDGKRIEIDEAAQKVVSIRNVAEKERVPKLTDVSQFGNTSDYYRRTGYHSATIEVQKRDCDNGICQCELNHTTDHDEAEPRVGLFKNGDYRPNGDKGYHEDCLPTANIAFMKSQSTGETHSLASAYFWLTDLSMFANSDEAAYDNAFDWDDYEAENLQVRVKKTEDSANASSGITEYTITLPMDAWDRNHENAAINLDTIAHEYGHVMHYMYGYDSDYDYDDGDSSDDEFMPAAISEGFADHNLLRYAFYRWRRTASRPFDSLPTLTYDTRTGGRSFDHSSTRRHGQWEPTWTDDVVFDDDSHDCTHDDPHECGRVIPLVYWELAWNICRTAYGSCNANQAIISSTTYAPDLLANTAFTYAITVADDEDDDPDDFFDSVASYYAVLLYVGVISTASYERVESVLGHHCVGPKSCWAHKLPGMLLPETRAHKATFATTCPASAPHECEELRHSDDFTLGPNTTRSSGNRIFTAKFAELHQAGDAITRTYTFPTAGTYELQASVRAQGTCCDSLFVEVDGGAPILWDIENTGFGSWRWSVGPEIVVTAGAHAIKLRQREKVDIEAVLVRKLVDSDGDGVPNRHDNCTGSANPNQLDSDGDARGDVCDHDADNDLICDPGAVVFAWPRTDAECSPLNDNCPTTPNADQSDYDADGLGNVCDDDIDNDTIPNSTDNCVYISNTAQVDSDGDGKGDFCDLVEIPDDSFEWLEFEKFLQYCFSGRDRHGICGGGKPSLPFVFLASNDLSRARAALDAEKAPLLDAVRKAAAKERGALVEAVNTVEAHARFGSVIPASVTRAKGKIRVAIKPGVPAGARGFRPVFPAVTFAVNGDESAFPRGGVAIRIDLSRFDVPIGKQDVKLMSARDKSYVNVTLFYDPDKRLLDGFVDAPANLVVMIPRP